MTAGIPDFQVTVRPGFPWSLLAIGLGLLLLAFLSRPRLPVWARQSLLVLGVILILGSFLL